MLKTKLTLVAVVAAFAFAPSISFAGDAPSVSYSAKKKGMVQFQDKAADTVSATADSFEGVNPADIEPAAGGYDVETTTKSVAEKIQLPRK